MKMQYRGTYFGLWQFNGADIKKFLYTNLNMFAYKAFSFWTPLGSATLLLDLSQKNRLRLLRLNDYRTDQVEIVPMGLPEFES